MARWPDTAGEGREKLLGEAFGLYVDAGLALAGGDGERARQPLGRCAALLPGWSQPHTVLGYPGPASGARSGPRRSGGGPCSSTPSLGRRAPCWQATWPSGRRTGRARWRRRSWTATGDDGPGTRPTPEPGRRLRRRWPRSRAPQATSRGSGPWPGLGGERRPRRAPWARRWWGCWPDAGGDRRGAPTVAGGAPGRRLPAGP